MAPLPRCPKWNRRVRQTRIRRPGAGGMGGPEPATRPEYSPDGQRCPWLPCWIPLSPSTAGSRKGIVIRDVRCADLPIGLPDHSDGGTEEPDRRIRLDGQLGPTEGHGTFIAGLIRQKCPTATILSVQVIQDDGVVAEADLLEALNKLWLRRSGHHQQPAGRPDRRGLHVTRLLPRGLRGPGIRSPTARTDPGAGPAGRSDHRLLAATMPPPARCIRQPLPRIRTE